MTNNHIVSALQAVDELEQLKIVKCLAEIAYEQLDNPLEEHEKTILRVEILLSNFLKLLDCHLEKLEHHIRVILD